MENIFETERLLVRPYHAGDFEDFYALNSDEEVMRYIRPAQSREDAQVFFTKIIEDYEVQPGLGRWAMILKQDNTLVGSFAVIPVLDSTDIQIGYALLKQNWGKGYASESVTGGIKYVFNKLGLSHVAGITEPGNVVSQKVLLKNGFKFEKEFYEKSKKLNLYRLYKKLSDWADEGDIHL